MVPIGSIFRECCPRCRRGAIYRRSLWRGWLAMHERCPVCGLKFEREPGYFLGAMYVSYALSVPPVIALVVFFWRVLGWPVNWALVCAFFAYLPVVPYVARIARVIFMYIDRAVDNS